MMIEYIQSLPHKGTKQVEEDLKQLCKQEGVNTIISIPFTGLAYLAGKVFLKTGQISYDTRVKLKVLEVCAESRSTMFDILDRFNATNDITKKLELAEEHQRELGKVALQLGKMFGRPSALALESKQLRLA